MHLHTFGTSGPNVVLLHGVPGSSEGWHATAEALADGHVVWIADLLGFGLSPRTPSAIDANAQAASLDEALAAVEVTKATIVGHDFGGPVAMSLYRRHPDLFEGFSVMATNAFPDTPIPFPLNMVTWPGVGNAVARVLFSGVSLQMMLWRYGGKRVGNARSARQIFTSALQELDERYRDYASVLQSVEVPSLVVWGDRDPFFPVEQGLRTAALMPHAETVILEGAGHFLPEQRPTELAAAIRSLVSRVRSGAPSTR